MKITIPEIPPSLNKYAGRLNGWEDRAEKQRWIGLMRAYCKKQKPMDKAIVTITYGESDETSRDRARCAGSRSTALTRKRFIAKNAGKRLRMSAQNGAQGSIRQKRHANTAGKSSAPGHRRNTARRRVIERRLQRANISARRTGCAAVMGKSTSKYA